MSGRVFLLALVLTACTDSYAPANESVRPSTDEDLVTVPVQPELFASVAHRWVGAGFPEPGAECTLPREVLADEVLFEDLCGASGPQACQRHDLIVVLDGWQLEPHRYAETRAHEIAHWLAECTGVASPRENFDHALRGVWWAAADGGEYVIKPWADAL